MTAPWSATWAAALRDGPVVHAARLVAYGPTLPEPVELPLESGTVTFDEAWAPHVQADLVLPIPGDVDVLDALDARMGARLALHAGYETAGGTQDVHQLADLALHSRAVTRPDDLLRLGAHSDELLVQQWTPLVGLTSPGTKRIVEAIAVLIEWVLLDHGVAVDVTATSPETIDHLAVDPNADVWGLIKDMADQVDAWVHVDSTGVWRVRDRPSRAGTAALIMSTGPGGMIVESDAVVSLDDWANAVRVTWGDEAAAWAQVTAGPMAPGPGVPTKVQTVQRPTPAPTSASRRENVAASILRRAVTRARSYTLTAPAAYWLRPGDTVTVQLPTGPQERHLVAAVRFDLARGQMTVKTRLPQGVSIATGE